MISPNPNEVQTMQQQLPTAAVSVVILPLPAQGHLNQLLHLSRHLAAASVPVHYVGSATHNRQARSRVHGWDPSSTNFLHFHDFPLPSFPSPPPATSTTPSFPSHLQPAFDAAYHLLSPLTSLLSSLSLSSRRVALVHDSSMSFAAAAADSLPSVEPYAFHSVSAFTNLFFLWDTIDASPPPSHFLSSLHLPDVNFSDCFSDEFFRFVRQQHQTIHNSDRGRLLNTCRAIEGDLIDTLAADSRWQGQKVFAVGPLNPLAIGTQESGSRHECLSWLDRQPAGSVIYVSFGTTSSLPEAQVKELADGLESSGQPFILVCREADRGDIYAGGGGQSVEPTVEYCCDKKGMVVKGWAPQLEILAHKSTAGFVSHCGWNSCMESLSMGVPILAWPMHSDQPRNMQLVTRLLKAGIAVRDWDRRGEVVPAAVIRGSIHKLMASDEGREVRRRAGEVGVVVRRAMSDGGTSRQELDAFIDYISR